MYLFHLFEIPSLKYLVLILKLMTNFSSTLWRPIFKKYSGIKTSGSEREVKHKSIESMKQECMTR